MKITKCLLLLAVAVVSFTSCDKKDTSVDPGIVGTWEGKWGFDADTPTYYEKWVIKSNGDLSAYDGSGDLYAKGSCHLDGVNFTAEYKPVGKDYSYKFSGLYHDVLNEIDGTWGPAPSTTSGGTFETYKQ